jgi:predicted secreted Zn-dependent protease
MTGFFVNTGIRIFALAWALLPLPAAAEWTATERIETYAISGTSVGDLYASIGDRGPKIGGGGGAIAHTNFKLTWTRNYVPGAGGCTLVSAQPKLIITYTLPKPASALPAPIRQKWQTFIAGVEKHERVHGDFIKVMVRQIEAASVGLTVADDPGCQKIRTELTRRLGKISDERVAKNRDFDRLELSAGGAVHQLILRFLNP